MCTQSLLYFLSCKTLNSSVAAQFYLQSYFMRAVTDKIYYECHKEQLFYMGYKNNELITPCFHQYAVLEVSQVKIREN